MCPSASSSVGTCVHDASHAYKSEVPVESKSSSEQPEQPESERRMDPDIPSEMLCEIATLEKTLNDFTKSYGQLERQKRTQQWLVERKKRASPD